MIELFSQDNRKFAKITTQGAELVKLESNNETNILESILWKMNDSFWNRVSPILFPLVGKLKNNLYSVNGQNFELPQHGFARNFEFQLVEKTVNWCKLKLSHSSQSLEIFPFEFELLVEYLLGNNSILVTNTVVNPSNNNPLLYSIGAHPGFHLNEALDNYSIQLYDTDGQHIAGDFILQRHLIQNGLYTGETEPVQFIDGQLKLHNSLFSSDAIVFKKEGIAGISIFRGMDFVVGLKCETAPYWGIWTKPQAPFLCLEPWDGIADHAEHNGDFYCKEGVVQLGPQSQRIFQYEIHW